MDQKDLNVRLDTPRTKQKRSSLNLALAKIFWMWYQKHKKQKQKSTDGTTSDLKACAQQQKKKSTKWKGNV